jgi:hypothetical protein
MLFAAAILLGILSGYTIRRLGTRKRLRPQEQKLLEPLGWALAGLWLMLAFLLLVWAAAAMING